MAREGRCITKYLRISSKKTKLIMDLIRNKKVNEAEKILYLTNKKGAKIALKVLKSALDAYEKNARDEKAPRDSLYVKVAKVDKGPSWYLRRPGWRGVPRFARRQTSHITIVVGERE